MGGGLLSVDLLGSALILPTGIDNLTVDSNATHIGEAALGFGYGVRVGVLNGGFPVPAVSLSWMHRTVPRLRYGTLGTAPGTGDDFEFTMDLKGDSYRAVAGWKFVLVDVAAGIGVDRYKSMDTNIRFYDSPTTTRTVVINPTNTRAVSPPWQDAARHRCDPGGGGGAGGGGVPRSGPAGAGRRCRAAGSRRDRGDRLARRGGCGVERAVPVCARAGGATLRRAQARDVDRRPDRRCRGQLAVGLGGSGARLRALVTRRVRRDRGRRHDRTPRQPTAHGARSGHTAPAAGARRVRSARDAQPRRAAREYRARGADLGDVVARRPAVERHPARAQRRPRVPPHHVARRTPHAARGRDPVAPVRGGRGAGRAAPHRRSGGPAVLGAGAGVARRRRRAGLSRRAAAPPRRRAALDAGGAAGSGPCYIIGIGW